MSWEEAWTSIEVQGRHAKAKLESWAWAVEFRVRVLEGDHLSFGRFNGEVGMLEPVPAVLVGSAQEGVDLLEVGYAYKKERRLVLVHVVVRSRSGEADRIGQMDSWGVPTKRS